MSLSVTTEAGVAGDTVEGRPSEEAAVVAADLEAGEVVEDPRMEEVEAEVEGALGKAVPATKGNISWGAVFPCCLNAVLHAVTADGGSQFCILNFVALL